MSQMPSRPRGLYFEEFSLGHKFVTAGRTVTEADVVSFAGLSGDFNQMHVDAEVGRGAGEAEGSQDGMAEDKLQPSEEFRQQASGWPGKAEIRLRFSNPCQ